MVFTRLQIRFYCNIKKLFRVTNIAFLVWLGLMRSSWKAVLIFFGKKKTKYTNEKFKWAQIKCWLDFTIFFGIDFRCRFETLENKYCFGEQYYVERKHKKAFTQFKFQQNKKKTIIYRFILFYVYVQPFNGMTLSMFFGTEHRSSIRK